MPDADEPLDGAREATADDEPRGAALLEAAVVVLYEPQDPINIGATVRAMKNMGVRDLRLIRPVAYDLNRIEQIAHDTSDVYRRIRHYESTEDCHLNTSPSPRD